MTTMTETTWLDLPGMPAIEGLRARRFRDADDYSHLSELMRVANLHDDIAWMPTAENLRLEMEGEPGIDPGADVVLVELDGRVIAEATVWGVARGGREVFEIGGHVAPDARGRGIGAALLAENVRRARERGMAAPGGGPVPIRSVVDHQETGHRALMERNGFEVVRHFFLMRREDLGSVTVPPLPEGLEIREVEPDQYRQIFDAEAEAFLDHWEARDLGDEQFVTTFARSELDTSLWVVAWDGDEVAGVVQTWIWPEENERLGVRRGWLEHISVRRPWRRRGLARAITAEAIRRLHHAGMDDAMLGVDAENPTGALGLYEGLGFEVATRARAYQLDLPRST